VATPSSSRSLPLTALSVASLLFVLGAGPLSLAQDSTPDAAASEKAGPAPTVVRKKPRELELSWAAVANASYTVWRKLGSKGEWRALKVVTEPRYVDQALLPRTIAYYKISAGEGLMTPVAGPTEALDDFYVDLTYVNGSIARLYYHQWREIRSEWTRSLAISAKHKEMISGSDIAGDFETQVKVFKVGAHPPPTGDKSEAAREYVKLMTTDHRILEVQSTDMLPKEVWNPQPKKSKTKAAGTGKTKKKRKKRKKWKKGDPITFPQPKIISELPGRRLEWEIVNQSQAKMHVVIRGRNSHNFKIGPDSTYVVKFQKGGDYKVQINVVQDDVLALVSEFGIKRGNRYQSIFAIKVLDESDPRVKNKRKNP
jgi:hypothetical protein